MGIYLEVMKIVSTFYQVVIKCNKQQENGSFKKVTERYLVDSMTCTEAESRVVTEMEPYIGSDFITASVTQSRIAEVFEDYEGDRYYSVIAALALEEKTTKVSYLVKAIDFRNALDNFVDGMKGTMADFEILSITETAIMDVFHVKAEEE